MGREETCEDSTLRRGLSFVSMTKSNLQSSQQRVSEDLIHWLRHDWCTKLRLPVQRQGIISGHSLSPSQWQILHRETGEGELYPNYQFKEAAHFYCLLQADLVVVCPGVTIQEPILSSSNRREDPPLYLLFPLCLRNR